MLWCFCFGKMHEWIGFDTVAELPEGMGEEPSCLQRNNAAPVQSPCQNAASSEGQVNGDVNLTAPKQVRAGKKLSLDIMMLMAGCKCKVTVPRRGPATSERMG